jgi:hypothetical protein
MHFNLTQTKWLKCIHLLAVAGWAGGALSLVILHFLRFKGAEIGDHLHGIDLSANLIDWWIIIVLGAFGCMITGLFYSICTNWGFFRHKWIVVKWIITLFCVISGTFCLGPWETTMVGISQKIGTGALHDATYTSAMYLNFWFGVLQIVLIVFAMFISVFKPWRGKQSFPAKHKTQ